MYDEKEYDLQEGAPNIFARRGVAPEIANNRERFAWFARGDYTGVDAAFPAGSIWRRQGRRIARNSDHWIFYQYAPPGLGLDRVLPEIKIMEPVYGNKEWHYHGTLENLTAAIQIWEALHAYQHEAESPEEHAECGERCSTCPPPLAAKDVHTSDTMESHIKRKKGSAPHKGTNTELIHYEINEQRFAYAKTPVVVRNWTDNHEQRFIEEDGDKEVVLDCVRFDGGRNTVRVTTVQEWKGTISKLIHLSRKHRNEDGEIQPPEGDHTHESRGKDPDGDESKRINMDPTILEGWLASAVVGLSMEGILKAASLQSVGLFSISIGSVSLGGNRQEWVKFSKAYLVGKTLLVFIDADGFENENVLNFGRMLASYLRELGDVDAVILCAPPLPEDAARDASGKPLDNGIDDFLGNGGNIEDVRCLDKTAPRWETTYEWMLEQGERLGWREDRSRRNAVILQRLAEWSDEDNNIRMSFQMLANAMLHTHKGKVKSYSDKTVKEGLIDLIDLGCIESDRPLIANATKPEGIDKRKKDENGDRTGEDRRRLAWKAIRENKVKNNRPCFTVLSPWQGTTSDYTLGVVMATFSDIIQTLTGRDNDN